MNSGSRLILGIDPGAALVGWSVINCQINAPEAMPILVGYGVIQTDAKDPTWKRLAKISHDFPILLRKYHPDQVVIERPFLAGTTNAALVHWATGVIVMSLGRCGCTDLDWYAPGTIKKQVTGSGSAKKSQVREAVAGILGIDHLSGVDDSVDAVAIALTYWKLNRR